jgi:lysophospholipase L1-like esterase
MTAAQMTDHWYVLSGVDVLAAAAARAVVVLGDSISDGRGSTTNGNDRWPDDLARRFAAAAATPAALALAVINQGIGGNAVTGGGLGPTALSRFSRDVLGQSGARWVIFFEGVNDLGGGVGAPAITSAYANLVAQAHAQGLLAFGATITPFGSNAYYTVAHESARQAVNTYIKSGVFDGIIDFDAAVRDTSNPPRLQAAYDSGDGLHLNPAGYRKLADTVDITLFAP